jgi:hypothetical protein
MVSNLTELRAARMAARQAWQADIVNALGQDRYDSLVAPLLAARLDLDERATRTELRNPGKGAGAYAIMLAIKRLALQR